MQERSASAGRVPSRLTGGAARGTNNGAFFPLMAIQSRFLVAIVGVWCVLAPSASTPGAAEPHVLEPAPLELAVAPPPSDDPGRPGLLGESLGSVPGSVARPLAIPEPELAPTDHDPWAEAPEYLVEDNRQVQYFLDRFTGRRREVVGRWLGRAGGYLGMIRETFRAQGLPEDLAFTAMIESGFQPLAVSRAGAKGLWQFMAATARRYGLRVDAWVDERLDPERSTLAAAAYLRDLHRQFGSWLLAQAAYNAGEVTVARAIHRAGSTDFWALARTGFLRRETKEFVPAIQAAILIGRDPARYGFEVGDAEPVEVERVAVPPSTDLRTLAAAAGVSAGMLRALNPMLVRGVTPPRTAWELRVPGGTRQGILTALAPRPTMLARPGTVGRAAGGAHVHVVRPSDTVSGIAKQYGVSVGDVTRWNSLGQPDRIRPGDRLRVAELR